MSFSKRHTLVVKGMAILMLVAYHCFSSVDRFYGHEVSFLFFSQKSAIYIFENMKNCVGIFAFLSAYGLTKSYMSAQSKSKQLSGCYNSCFVIKRIVTLIGAFTLPAALCVIASAFLSPNYKPYGKGIEYVFNITADLLGFGELLGSKTFIGTWWYMSLAIVIIALIPFTVKLFDKFGCMAVVPYIILPVLLNSDFFSENNLSNMTTWLLCIPLGTIFAKTDLLDRLRSHRITKNKYISKIFKLIIYTALLFVLIRLRAMTWVELHAYYFINTIIPVFFVYYLYEFVTDLPIISSVLSYLGKHSSNIFYTHTFIRGVWFSDFTYGLNNAVLIYLFVLLSSLAISYAIMFIKYITHYDKLIKFISNKASAVATKLSFCR